MEVWLEGASEGTRSSLLSQLNRHRRGLTDYLQCARTLFSRSVKIEINLEGRC